MGFPSQCLQALSQKEAEKNLLLEKLNESQRELALARSETDRVKLDALHHQEQDKVSTGLSYLSVASGRMAEFYSKEPGVQGPCVKTYSHFLKQM